MIETRTRLTHTTLIPELCVFQFSIMRHGLKFGEGKATPSGRVDEVKCVAIHLPDLSRPERVAESHALLGKRRGEKRNLYP